MIIHIIIAIIATCILIVLLAILKVSSACDEFEEYNRLKGLDVKDLDDDILIDNIMEVMDDEEIKEEFIEGRKLNRKSSK